MQRHMGNIQDELRKTQNQLYEAEEERDRAVDELREMKKVAQEANMRLSEALSSKRSGELYTELSAAKKSLSDATRELQLKEKSIESLRLELEKVQLVELKLAERDAAVDKLKKELNIAKITESHTVDSLSESKARIQELERELEKKKDSEAQVFDSLVSQTKQLEQTKISLEESKLEIASLHDREQILEGSYGQSSRDLDLFNNCLENTHSRKEELESLKSDLHQAKGNLAHAQKAEHLASSQTQAVLQEMGLLKSELKLALEAEEKSKKAMDDLALALTEVATEANQAKEKLSSTQAELENKKEEAEQLKQTLKTTESKYQILLDEARKEMEYYKNISERLRSEAEESLLAWNLKETEFVNCMKEAEEEKIAIQQENTRMTESMKAAEDMKKASREENHKLRDILRQALNESNVAKEAAGIARAENSQLKDCLAEKDDVLDFFTRENERLRVSEAAANQNIKELKYLLSTGSAKEVKTEEKEVAEVKTHKPTAKVKTEDKEVAEVKTHKPNAKVKPEDKEVAEVNTHKPTAKVKAEDKEVAEVKEQKPPLKEHHDGKKSRNTFSFDLEELKIPVKPKDEDEDFLIEEALKGSIFDTESPPVPVHHHRKMSSSFFTDDGETIGSEDFDNLEGQHFDEADHERNSHRKKKALLRRFGDLIRRKSFHQRAGMNEPNAQ
ncbi:hypothetical protein PVL29_026608 [Vitis rotundifolia]|uniref:WEB family protein n=1 Tax=Vitis rotundifolia TaxID=103349 RepID=A0AA39D323_VITRO|nr:hypothetical protein PVL29_026608 [Vitis rotundifolia]